MGLPAFTIPTPDVQDTLQYPAGSKVGIDTATDKWLVNAASTNGMLIALASGGWSTAGGRTGLAVEGGFQTATYISSFGPDQWAASQCVVPLDDQPGTCPGVRLNVETGHGYYLKNMGYTEAGFVLSLHRRSSNGDVTLATYVINDNMSNTFEIDGLLADDGFMAILEVAGSNPTQLRVSYAVPQYSDGHVQLTTLPALSNGTSGNPAIVTEAIFEDNSGYQVLTGQPGFIQTTGNSINSAGGAFNFMAGQIGDGGGAVVINGVAASLQLQANAPTILVVPVGVLAVQAVTANLTLVANIPGVSIQTLATQDNPIRAPGGDSVGIYCWDGSQHQPVIVSFA